MDLETLRALIAVVEMGSFVAAGRRLGMARPTLRRRIEALEAEVGTALFVRTRSGTTPTEAGRLLAHHAGPWLRDGNALLAAVRDLGTEPRGEIRLVMPSGVAPQVVVALMMALRSRYPALHLRLRTADDPIAALQDDVDVALAFGDRRPGGRWISMEVLRIRQWLLASPAYLAAHGTPSTIEELMDHELLAWAAPGEDPTQWACLDGRILTITPALASPDVHLLRNVAAAGLGVAFLPDGLLPEPGPPLVPVLPEVVGQDRSVRIVVPAAMEGIPRIKALLSELRGLRDTFFART
ncbi:MAG: LysR family transcriptional regulator [Myxococcota bacterium]